MKRQIKSAILTIALAGTVLAGSKSTAYAVELTDSKTDGAGNYFSSGEVVSTKGDLATDIENECFLAGQTVYCTDTFVDGSAFIAGANIEVENSVIGSSLFVAGSDISIDADVNNNIWVAGANISTSDNTRVKGIHSAGANMTIRGQYDQVDVCGGTVIFDGKVDGDVNISAENVTIGDNADVTGTLNITYSSSLNQSSLANIPNVNITKVETEEKDTEAVAENLLKARFISKVKSVIFHLFSNTLLAFLLALLFNSSLNKSYEYCTKRTGAFIGFGALVAIMGPTAILITLITFVGAPTAGLAMMCYLTVMFGCKIFTFASLVREAIFTHTKSRFHPFIETIIAVLPLALLNVIPVLKSIIGLACAIYTWGYIVLALYDKLSAEKKARLENVETEEKADSAE